MTIKLSRSILIIITISTILTYLLLNRFDAIRERDKTIGVVTRVERVRSLRSSYISYVATISYQVGKNKCYMKIDHAEKIQIGDTFELIYDPDEPTNVTTFDFRGFWMAPLIFCIIPLLFLNAFILSFVGEKDIIKIEFKNGFKISKTKKLITENFQELTE